MSHKINHPQRRSIRLKGYDYSSPGAYFVTVCTRERLPLLGMVNNAEIILTPIGHIVEAFWNLIPQYFKGVGLDVYVVMPNHLHGVIVLSGEGRGEALAEGVSRLNQEETANASPLHPLGTDNPPSTRRNPRGTQRGSLGAIIQNFKSVSTRKGNQLRGTPGVSLWQRNYYEHIIRNKNELNRIRRYIVDNPLKWEWDKYHPMRG